jgi:hypothetical protein
MPAAFDAESFFWVLIWTAHRYEGGVVTRPHALKPFASLTQDTSATAKFYFLGKVEVLQLTPSHQGNLETLENLRDLFFNLVNPRVQQPYGKITDEKIFELMHDRLSPQFGDDLDEWLAEQYEKSGVERNPNGTRHPTLKPELWKSFPKEPIDGEKTSTIQQQSMLDSEMWAKLISPSAFEPLDSASF